MKIVYVDSLYGTHLCSGTKTKSGRKKKIPQRENDGISVQFS